jgi:methyl-accepting chemotaxis protein
MISTPRRSLTIAAQLSGFAAILLLILCTLGLVAIRSTNKLSSLIREVSDVQMVAVREMTLVDMMHDAIRASTYAAIIASQNGETERFGEIRKELAEHSGAVQQYLGNLDSLPLQAETKQAIAKSRAPLKVYTDSAELITKLAFGKQLPSAFARLPEFQNHFESLEKELEALGELIEADAKETRDQAVHVSKNSNATVSGTLVGGILLGLLASALLIRRLSRTLRALVTRVSQESSKVQHGSEQINASSENLSTATQRQAAALEQTAASVNEITSMVQKSAESSETSLQIVTEGQSRADGGKRSIQQVDTAIKDIQASNESMLQEVLERNQRVGEISAVISEIAAKTKVINDIVFQTKLLSFNASVEAARAGEHGKGFSVVAEEVGKLAQLSGGAAKEINDLIQSSSARVASMVESTKTSIEKLIAQSKQKIDEGVRLTEISVLEFDKVAANMAEVSRIVTEITIANKEQAQGINEINKAIAELEQVTHTNSKTSQDTALYSNQMFQQANSLRSCLSEVIALVGGTGDATLSSQPEAEPITQDAIRKGRESGQRPASAA